MSLEWESLVGVVGGGMGEIAGPCSNASPFYLSPSDLSAQTESILIRHIGAERINLFRKYLEW